MNYFAYGSNLSVQRLTHRLSSAIVVSVTHLPAHKLVFHMRGADGSAKCDAFYTGNVDDGVIGVIYEITETEKLMLDRIEGRGHGYKEKTVHVHTSQGKTMEAMAYFAKIIDASLKPYHWYKEHVLAGAREHDFPEDYIQNIELIESIEDPLPDRHARELQIYR